MSSSRDSAWIGPGIVAEKNSVCRRGGRCFSTRRMSGRKPMSSIRSASSSTSTSRPDSAAYGCLKWSSSRPGVAMMTSTPLRKACSCGPIPTPPKTAAPDSGVCTASSRRCSSICAASSRVGVSTSARVTPRGLSISRCRIGRRNAAVLPLPVIAQASRSLPSRAGGIACSWMGVARVKPSSRTPRSRSGWSLNLANGIGRRAGDRDRASRAS